MDCPEQEPAPEPCQGYLRSFKSIIQRNEASYTSDYGYGRSSEKDQGQAVFQDGGGQEVRPDRFNNNTYSPEKCDSQSVNVPCRYLNSLSQIEAPSRDQGDRSEWSGYNHNCSINHPPVSSNTQNAILDDNSSSILELGLGSYPSDILKLPATSQHRPGSVPMPYASMLRSRDFGPFRSVPEGRTGSSPASMSCYPAILPNQTSGFPGSPNPLQIAQTLASLGGSIRQCDTRTSYENDISDGYSAVNKACGAVSWPLAWNSPMYGLHIDPYVNQSFQCQTGDHQSGICDGYKIDWSSSCHNKCDDYICADDDCSSDGCSEADDCVACHDAIFPCKDECPEVSCTEGSCSKGPTSSFCQALHPSYCTDYSFAGTQQQFSFPQCAWHSNGTHYNMLPLNSESFNYGSHSSLAEHPTHQACGMDEAASNSSGYDASRNHFVCLVPNCTVNGRCFKDMNEYKQHFIDVHCHYHRPHYLRCHLGCHLEDSLGSRILRNSCPFQSLTQDTRGDCVDTTIASKAAGSLDIRGLYESPRTFGLSGTEEYKCKLHSPDTPTSKRHVKPPLPFPPSPEEAQNICKVRLHDGSGHLCGASFETSKDLHLHLESTHSKLKREEGQKEFVCPWDNCQKRILKLKPHYRTHSGCMENAVPFRIPNLLTLCKLRKPSARIVIQKFRARML